MEDKKADRRTARTQKAIKSAFLSLLAENELSKITVREIADSADVNRATFYKHYLDVYDLYDKVEQEILIDWSTLILDLVELESSDFFRGLVSYISDNRDVFRMVFSPNSPVELRVKLYRALEGLFKQMTSEEIDTDIRDDRLTFMTCYRAQGCLSVLSKWVAEGFRQPEKLIIQIITELDSNTASII